MSPKSLTIGIPPSRRAALEEFLQREALSWAIVDSPGGDISIIEAPPKSECGPDILHPGGRIACSVALAMAGSLGVPGKKIGGLMNLLEIRIHDCQLGCFP
jgi:hypothetical protein